MDSCFTLRFQANFKVKYPAGTCTCTPTMKFTSSPPPPPPRPICVKMLSYRNIISRASKPVVIQIEANCADTWIYEQESTAAEAFILFDRFHAEMD